MKKTICLLLSVLVFLTCFPGVSVFSNDEISQINEQEFWENFKKTTDFLESDIVIPEGITAIPEKAFWGFECLRNVSLPSSLTSIGAHAFDNCTLESITIPESVAFIGENAFGLFREESCFKTIYCKVSEKPTGWDENWNITTATVYWNGIPEETAAPTPTPAPVYSGKCGENVTWSYDKTTATLRICGEGPMSDYSLITIQPGSIYNNPVYGSSAPWYGFRSETKTIEIEDGVTHIGVYAFRSFSNMENLYLPESLISVGDFAFYKCSQIDGMHLPDSIESIGEYAFFDTIYDNLVLPRNLRRTGECAFGCSNKYESLKLYVPEGIQESIFWYGFDRTLYFFCETEDANFLSDKPRKYNGISRFEFDYWASFDDYKDVTELSIPEGITAIPSGLTWPNAYVTLPKSLKTIDSNAFKSGEIKGINIPVGIKSITGYTFYYCSKLEYVTIESEDITIGESAFEGCSKLRQLDLGNGVTSIGRNAFLECPLSEEVTIPISVVKIDINAFSDNAGIKCFRCEADSKPDAWSVSWNTNPVTVYWNGVETLPEGECGKNVRWRFDKDTGELIISGSGEMTDYSASNYAPWIAYMDDVTKIIIEDGVTSVGRKAFYKMHCVTECEIADSVKVIKDYAFQYCTLLETVRFSENTEKIGASAFEQCGSLRIEGLPSGLKRIETKAFYLVDSTKNATNIVLPSSLEYIGASAFCIANLNVYIPASVTTISKSAFIVYGSASIVSEYDTKPNGWDSSWTGNKAMVRWLGLVSANQTPAPSPTPKISYVSIISKPSRISYYLGETFDPSGLQVRVTYSNGAIKDLGPADLLISKPDSNLTGIQYVTIEYEGISRSFGVKFSGRSDVRGIKIAKKPNKLVYDQGERLDPDGIIIYSIGPDLTVNGEIDPDDSLVKYFGYRNDEAGLYSIKVVYMDCYSTSFSYKVTNNKLVSSYVVTKPTKLVYNIGDKFDFIGVTGMIKYYDGTTAPMNISDLTVTGFDSSKAGIQNVQINCKGILVKSFSIKVI